MEVYHEAISGRVGGELGWMVQIIIIAFVPFLAHPPLRTLPLMCCNKSQASFRSFDRLSNAAFSVGRAMRDAAARSTSHAALVFLRLRNLSNAVEDFRSPKQKQDCYCSYRSVHGALGGGGNDRRRRRWQRQRRRQLQFVVLVIAPRAAMAFFDPIRGGGNANPQASRDNS